MTQIKVWTEKYGSNNNQKLPQKSKYTLNNLKNSYKIDFKLN